MTPCPPSSPHRATGHDGNAERPRDFAARLPRRNRSMIAHLRHKLRYETTSQALGIVALMIGVALIASQGTGYGSEAAAATITAVAADMSVDGVEPMPFERKGESFPGSAFYYLDAAADSAPAPLPGGSLAPDAHWDNEAPASSLTGGFGAGPAARALRQAGTELDRTRALSCLTAAIYYEAASEPDPGQRAVAQVVLNRVAHPAFPKTVCGVVYQGSERSTGCQFSFTCDGALTRKPVRMFWDRAEAVARTALSGYVDADVGLATHYHTFAVHPYWAPSLHFLGQIGAHRFYRMAGPAGAEVAFHFAYAGREPLASGHLRNTAAASPTGSPDPLAIERAYEVSLRAAHGNAQQVGLIAVRDSGPALAPAPAYAGEAIQRGGDAAFRAQALPGTNNVRSEYQASGSWIANPE